MLHTAVLSAATPMPCHIISYHIMPRHLIYMWAGGPAGACLSVCVTFFEHTYARRAYAGLLRARQLGAAYGCRVHNSGAAGQLQQSRLRLLLPRALTTQLLAGRCQPVLLQRLFLASLFRVLLAGKAYHSFLSPLATSSVSSSPLYSGYFSPVRLTTHS